VQPKRSVEETAKWLKQHPEVEIVSRDRCGLYAQGAQQDAPQAKQVADRFHLLQNLREAIEQQMTKHRGYTGSLSHLHRLLAKWRHPNREEEAKAKPPAAESRAIDPATGWQISPIVAQQRYA
jgi:transposase